MNKTFSRKLLSGFALWAFCGLLAVSPPSSTAEEKAGLTALELARQLNEAFIQVAEMVSPAVVVIEVAPKAGRDVDLTESPFWDLIPREHRRQLEEFFRREGESERELRPERRGPPAYTGRGSGIVIRENGFILTNSHVVENAELIRVKFRDGRRYSAEIQGIDLQSDIAVIKIEAENLPVAKLGDSTRTRVGEFAIAIGAPFDLDYSVTFGHVSAKGRTGVIPTIGEGSLGAVMDQDFIQTDASINPGNSGGPLVNIYGEVIGVNTLIRGLRTGIGFAIPVNLARAVSDGLIEQGRYARAWIGIGIRPVSEDAQFRKHPGLENGGVLVASIEPGGPAAKSELRVSDIILSVDGRTVRDALELRTAVRAQGIGSELNLAILRPGRGSEGEMEFLPKHIQITTEEWPDLLQARQASPSERESTEEPITRRALGLTVQALTPELAGRFGIDEATEGVIVTAVEPDSPAAARGLKPGDIITEVEYQTVRNPREFQEALQEPSGKGVLINLISEGSPRFEILKDSGD
jgi:serine protease Do